MRSVFYKNIAHFLQHPAQKKYYGIIEQKENTRERREIRWERQSVEDQVLGKNEGRRNRHEKQMEIVRTENQ